jgi:hypothetical protein
MSFENPNEGVKNNPVAASAPEVFKKDIELSPAMQAMYEEIVAEKTDEGRLESEARKMSAMERMGVLGKAIGRAGKLARRIAVVAFAAFSPSLAGGADTVKQIEKDLMNATQNEWQNIKTEKLSPKEQRLMQERKKAEADKKSAISEIEETAVAGNVLSEDEKLSYEQRFGLSREQIDSIYKVNKVNEQETLPSAPTVSAENKKGQSEEEKLYTAYWAAMGEPTGGRSIPWSGNNFEEFDAFKKGFFKNPAEYKKWKEEWRLREIKKNMQKYPEVVAELRANIDKFKNGTNSEEEKFRDYLEDKYIISGHNPAEIILFLEDGIRENIDPNK